MYQVSINLINYLASYVQNYHDSIPLYFAAKLATFDYRNNVLDPNLPSLQPVCVLHIDPAGSRVILQKFLQIRKSKFAKEVVIFNEMGNYDAYEQVCHEIIKCVFSLGANWNTANSGSDGKAKISQPRKRCNRKCSGIPKPPKTNTV